MSDQMTEPWRQLLARALEHAVHYRASLPAQRVAPTVTAESLLQGLTDTLPAEGVPAAQVLEELVALATPGLSASSGPRFFGWVTGGALSASIAADWMTSVWDQNAGPAGGAPAALAFELAAVRALVDVLSLPEQTAGALCTGASMANFTALCAARTRVLAAAGWDLERDGLFGAPLVKVLVGRERHDSIDRALRLLGFGKRAMRVIDADREGRLAPEALSEALRECSGPVIVCAQTGNVNSGSFDPLPEIHAALAEYRSRSTEALAWLHVDGAFGIWARAARELAPLARGLELADSWATDAHKFLNVPYDSGVVLTRHPREHRRAFAISAPYLQSGTKSAIPPASAFTPELSRRARGFALWAALRQLGRDGLDALVSRCARHARALAAELASTAGLRVENDVVFNQVVVSVAPPAGADGAIWIDQLTRAVQHEGTCYVTPTRWRGVPALRFSFVNADTGEDDVQRSAAALQRVYAEQLSSGLRAQP